MKLHIIETNMRNKNLYIIPTSSNYYYNLSKKLKIVNKIELMYSRLSIIQCFDNSK